MKKISVITAWIAYAVPSWSGWSTRSAQSGRMLGSKEAEVAPTTAPSASRTPSGAPASVAATSAQTAAKPAIASGTKVRVWPKRSIRRPWIGPEIAEATATAAVIAPARAKEPVSRWTMSTIASGEPTLSPAISAEPTTTWTCRLPRICP